MESEEFAFHFGMQRQSAKYCFRDLKYSSKFLMEHTFYRERQLINS